MKPLLSFLFKLFLFWMCFFLVQRTVFLCFQLSRLPDISMYDYLLCSRYAFAMDIAAFFYLFMISFILITALIIRHSTVTKFILMAYQFVMIVFTSFITVVDIGLCQAWGSKINRKAISYLDYPEEVFISARSSPYMVLLAVFLILSITGIWCYKRFVHRGLDFRMTIYQKIIVPIALLTLIIIGARGGVQEYPISKSWSYYSIHTPLNLAAVNSFWNLVSLGFEKEVITVNEYSYYPADEAEKVFRQIHEVKKDTGMMVLNRQRPNIVILMLESWSADVIAALGGEKGVTPEFSKLCKEGLLFPNFYAAGFRTEQGLAAINGGFPSQPLTTIIRKYGKFEYLPSLVAVLGQNGYHSSYYYGGDLTFANTNTYLQTAGFNRIIGENDFEFNKRTYWGAYDEELFTFTVNDQKNNPEPFFSLLMTSTSHEPFDLPMDEGFQEKDMPQMYRNTVHYTDRCLGDYMKSAKQQPWFERTLFVILADHAHFLPLYRKHNEPQRHRIPFLLLGGALKKEFRGKTIEKVAGQIDVPAILLSQLELAHDDFPWSKNTLNPYSPGFAFYAFDEGFGWVNDRQSLVYDHQLKQVVSLRHDSLPAPENDLFLKQGKVYLQQLMEAYINFND